MDLSENLLKNKSKSKSKSSKSGLKSGLEYYKSAPNPNSVNHCHVAPRHDYDSIIIIIIIIINEKINVAFSRRTARTRNSHKKHKSIDDMRVPINVRWPYLVSFPIQSEIRSKIAIFSYPACIRWSR